MAGRERAVHGASYGFADYRTHAAADKAVLHHTEDDVVRAEHAGGVDDRIVEPGLPLGFLEALLVRL